MGSEWRGGGGFEWLQLDAERSDRAGRSELAAQVGVRGDCFCPPGVSGLAGGGPATFCASSSESPNSTNDCTAVPGTQRCKPANLVSGDGVDDGRCSLVGLSW